MNTWSQLSEEVRLPAWLLWLSIPGVPSVTRIYREPYGRRWPAFLALNLGFVALGCLYILPVLWGRYTADHEVQRLLVLLLFAYIVVAALARAVGLAICMRRRHA